MNMNFSLIEKRECKKIKVLFLCIGNSCRSQMAEGLLRYFGNGKFEVFSAGVKPSFVHPLTIKVMNELGIDISNQKSKCVDEFIEQNFDYVITVCDNAKESCPHFPGQVKRIHWSFQDPADATGSEEEKLKVFRKVRDEIMEHILVFIQQFKLWFSILSKDARYFSYEPNFIDTKEFEWIAKHHNIAEIIRKELTDYIKNKQLKAYFNTKMSDNVKKWKTLSLKWWGLEFYNNQKYFPQTTKFINQIPDLISASFNLLEPHSTIYPHCGDTNGIYRMHLGLIIPASLPECGFKVENEERAWKEGEWLAFIDAKQHQAWNHTDNNRFIFVIDVVRPEFRNRKCKIITTVLTGLFLQRRAEKYPFMYKLQSVVFLKKPIVFSLLPICFMAIKTRNFLSKMGFFT